MGIQKALEAYLKYIQKFTGPDYTMIRLAIRFFIARLDLDISVDCKNNDNKTSLHEAAQFSQHEACKTLLEHGANVNALKRADWTALMLACTKVIGEDSLKTVNILLKHGAIVNHKNKDGWTVLHLISREGDVAIFNLLLKHGLDVTVKTKNGRSALHIAALHGNSEIVKLLLDLGLNVDERDSCGNTPLQEAVLGRDIEICKILIDNKANIYSKNNSDYSILHLAASEGHLGVIDFVLHELKLNVNEANKNSVTALHCAARKHHLDAYNYLVENGGDVTVKDNFNRLPSH
ncbi:hypothetical protein NQ318_011245 [Aromia moschata]|uniref:Uncharacterized protein n=1 Tax=Aromia moschata TaxID=1265417 RepID=A0AAV8YI13_9CUCU|nr:hypothetical protein NQ318_011245 [Aromia moschata]